MSGDIGKGDWVQSVRTSRDYPNWLREGGVYCVSDVVPAWGSCFYCGQDADRAITLVGSPSRPPRSDGYLWSWCHCFFTRLGGPKASLSTPVREKADA